LIQYIGKNINFYVSSKKILMLMTKLGFKMVEIRNLDSKLAESHKGLPTAGALALSHSLVVVVAGALLVSSCVQSSRPGLAIC
jgi:hypothetical protein